MTPKLVTIITSLILSTMLRTPFDNLEILNLIQAKIFVARILDIFHAITEVDRHKATAKKRVPLPNVIHETLSDFTVIGESHLVVSIGPIHTAKLFAAFPVLFPIFVQHFLTFQKTFNLLTVIIIDQRCDTLGHTPIIFRK